MLDTRAKPLLAFRTAFCDSVEVLLFALMTLGDDRVVRATYVAVHRVFDRDARMEPFSYPLRCCGSTAHQ